MNSGGSGWKVHREGYIRVAGHPFDWIQKLGFSETISQIRSSLRQNNEVSSFCAQVCERMFAKIPSISNAKTRRQALAVRRDLFNHRLPSDGNLNGCIDTFRELDSELAEDIVAATSNLRMFMEHEQNITMSFLRELEILRINLASYLNDDQFLEAIILSVPEIASGVIRYREAALRNPKENSKRMRQMEVTVLSFLVRACTRPVPLNTLGRYAACRFDSSRPTKLRLQDGSGRIVRSSPRIAISVIDETEKLFCALLAQDNLERPVSPRNIRREGSSLRWYARIGDEERLCRIELTEAVAAIIRLADGSRLVPELLQEVSSALEMAEDDMTGIESFYDGLKCSGFLSTSFHEAVCSGVWPTHYRPLAVDKSVGLHDEIMRLQQILEKYPLLTSLEDRLRAIDTLQAGLQRLIESRSPVSKKGAFTFDSILPFDFNLGHRWPSKLVEGLGAYLDFLVASGVGSSELHFFGKELLREPFKSKTLFDFFPLSDSVTSFRLGRSLSNFFAFHRTNEGAPYSHYYSLYKQNRSVRNNRQSDVEQTDLNITASTICLTNYNPFPGLPLSQTAICSIAAKTVEEVEGGQGVVCLREFRFGWSGFLSRYALADAGSAAMSALDMLLGKIDRTIKTACFDGPLSANIACLRNGDVCIADVDGLTREECPPRLPLSKITVVTAPGILGLAVIDETDSTEILPLDSPVSTRQSSLAEIVGALSPQQFVLSSPLPNWLIDPSKRFDAVSEVSFCPRIISSQMVISPASWLVPRRELTFLLQRDDLLSRFRSLTLWRDVHEIPRFVEIRRHDPNRGDIESVFADLENPLFLLILDRRLRLTEADMPYDVVFSEHLPGPDDLWFTDERGRYVSDFVFELHHDA